MSSPYDLGRNVVVVASAGTGKTHTLVGALLHALLGLSAVLPRGSIEPVHPARIVATTFSRKAAAEIRERLATTLATLAGGGATAYDADFAASAARLGVSLGESALAARARRALGELGRANLSTLHGFAYKIARRAAFEPSAPRTAPPGFALLDEEENQALVRAAAEHAIAAYYRADPDAARDQTRVARGTDRLEDAVRGWLLGLEDEGARARDIVVPKGDEAEIVRTFEALVRAAEGVLGEPEHRAAAMAVLAAAERGGAQTPPASLADALSDLFDFRRSKNASPAVLALADLRDSLPKATHRERGRIFARFYEARASIGKTATGFRELLVLAQDELHRRYSERAAVGFGAVLAAARDALRDSPALAAELGARWDLFVVDEFQDTSRVQRELVYLLWDRDPLGRPAGTLPRRLRDRGLFVVGDRKQSIYGFRGADVAVFSETCVDLAGDRAREALLLEPPAPQGEPAPAPMPPTADFYALRTNRRSAPEILRFVNAMASELLRGDPFDPVRYAPETEDLHPPQERVDEGSPRVSWLRLDPRRETKKKDDALLVARAIEERIAGGARFRDVAVLAQTNPMLDAVAHQLARRDIPYVAVGRGFYRAKEVGDVLALLRVLVRRDDRAAWLTVLRGVWTGVYDRTLLALTEPGRGLTLAIEEWTSGTRRSLLDEVDREPLRQLVDVVRRLRHAAPRLGPGGALREAVRELRFEESLILLPRGAQRVANVRKLLAMADREPRPEVFLDRCRAAAEAEREGEAATFSESDDAVRLLTVHASKGLAFPIVILPELRYRPPGPGSGAILLGKDERGVFHLGARVLDAVGDPHATPSFNALAERAKRAHVAERRRLWYVAITRAERELVFVGDTKPTPNALAAPTPWPILERLSADPARAAALGLTIADATPARPSFPPPRSVEPPPVELVPLRLPSREVPIAATTLQDFIHCPRRFQLAHLFDLTELAQPSFSARAQDIGAERAKSEGTFLHRLLEVVPVSAFGADDARSALDEALRRGGLDPLAPFAGAAIERASRFLESDYARSIRTGGATILREHAFVVPIGRRVTETALTDGVARSSDALTVVLRGAIDLLVLHADGAIDVIDYKRARGPDVEPYVPQLAMYALAAAELGGRAADAPVRAGIVFLGASGPAEPRFAKLPRLAKLTKDLEAHAQRLREARATERFPRVPEARCLELRCGYRSLCHPPAPGQLGLFGR